MVWLTAAEALVAALQAVHQAAEEGMEVQRATGHGPPLHQDAPVAVVASQARSLREGSEVSLG